MQDIENHIINNENMKITKKLILALALMAVFLPQLLAQNNNVIMCADTDCVFEILEKMQSDDDIVVADAKKSFMQLVDRYRNTGDSQIHNALMKSTLRFVEKCSDSDCVPFLLSSFPRFCTADDIHIILQLIDNDRLADGAIRAVGDINGSHDYIEIFIIKHNDALQNKAAWAYAIGKQNITTMEDELISWLDDADNETKIEIYNALLVIGNNDKTTAIIRKGAKKLNKSKVAAEKIAGMRLLVAIDGETTLPILYKALKNKNGEVRKEALELLKPFVNQEVVNIVVKNCNKDEALVDAVTWLGEIKNDSQMPLIINQLSSENPRLVEAAIRAVFLIDKVDGINAVKPMFGGDYQDVIQESMILYEGDCRAVLTDVMRGNERQIIAGLQILEIRPILAMCGRVKDLLYSDNQEIRDRAYGVLRLVVMPSNADFLKGLLDYCDEKYVEDVQIAIKNAMKNTPDNIKDMFASTLKHITSDKMPRFYKVFAYFGTELCVDKLIDAYQNGSHQFEAKEALMLVENKQFEDKINEVLK